MSDYDYAHDLRRSVIPAVGSIYKWLLASLVTVNGGALVAITQQPANDFALLRSAGVWFGWGLIAVIAGAYAMTFVSVMLMANIVGVSRK